MPEGFAAILCCICFIAALFLAGCVFANAETQKNIKSGLVTDAALHRAKHR
jgi:hypothetical protein